MTDDFDPRELAAAERLDAEITAIRAGRPPASTEPTALWLAASLSGSTPSKTLRRRIAAGVLRRPAKQLLPRLAAGALALVLLWHAVSNFFLADWVAANLGEPYSPHAAVEGAWATLAVAIAVGAGALHRRWLPVSVSTGVPLGFLLGAGGVSELGVFPLGAVFHLSEGVLAAVLFVTWYVGWRYGQRRRAEDRA